MKSTSPPPENPFVNLIVNILLPVLFLKYASKHMDARLALGIALCFPLGYGLQDYARRKHKNYVSLIGVFNVMLTGTLVVMNLKGMWFAFKEATLPLVLGAVVFGSAFTESPAARVLFCNPQILNMALIDEKLAALGRLVDFRMLLKRTTLWLSLSFVISSSCNFLLALRIFTDIDPSLERSVQDQMLNDQIAHMTAMGFAVIALPLMVFSGTLVYTFLHSLAKLTDVPLNSLLKE